MQWLQKLFRKKSSQRGIVGISFLPHGVTIAISNYTKDNNALELIHCEFIETEKTDDYSTILDQWFITHELDHYDCHLVLDINDYQRVNIEAPVVPVNEMCLAIRWKINELIDFSVDDAVIDYYTVPAFNGNNTSLEVIVCSKTIIKPLVEYCTDAGLHLKVIDIQETSLRNLAALLPNNKLGGTAVLYLQKSFGIILIQKQGVIYVARKITIGYEKLDLESQLVSASYGGLSLEMDNQAAMLLDNLALEIQRSLDYVESYYHIGSIAELAVIPWSFTTQRLVDSLNNNYRIYSYLVDLSLVLECDMTLDYLTQSLCTPAIGATLRNTTLA